MLQIGLQNKSDLQKQLLILDKYENEANLQTNYMHTLSMLHETNVSFPVSISISSGTLPQIARKCQQVKSVTFSLHDS